jgi:hypothetical protein
VNLARVGRILRDSKKDILDGRDDLEKHQRWVTRHRMASADDLTCHKQRLNSRCEFSAFKRLVISLIGFVASACIALRRSTTWIFASLFDLLSVSPFRTRVLYVLGLQPKPIQAPGFLPTIHQASATGHSTQTLSRELKDFPQALLVAEVAKFRTARFSRFVIASLVGRRVLISILGPMAVETWARECARLPSPRKADQDRLDSVLCALIGYHWRSKPRAESLMIGDLATGYMIAPSQPNARARLETAAARCGVPCI